MDATRTEPDFLCRCVEAAIKAGATTINIPDTVGYTVPEEIHEIIKMLRERVPGADKAIFLDALPQRSGPGRRQQPGRCEGRRAPDRVHDQWPRRARRQRGAGRGRDGDQDPQRCHALLDWHRHHHDHARLAAGLRRDRVPDPVQQGHRRHRMPSRTSPASTRMACSRTRRPTRS